MKKLCILLAILLLFTLITGCKEKSADPTKPATDPAKVANGSDSTEATGASQTEKPDNTRDEEPVVKVQDSKNIMSMQGVVSAGSTGEYWSWNFTEKAIAEYSDTYTPFVSKMDNGVLDGVTEISFEPDCKYDIVSCKVSIATLVDNNDPGVEYRGVGHKAKVEFNDRKVTVDFGWWHETDNWTKTYKDWSYGICVKDKGGNFYNYYFRVEYATTDPVGLFEKDDYAAFLTQEWYRCAMNCTFAKPEEVSAKYYFYGGVGDYGQFTEEELAYFKATYSDCLDVRMPVEKMNKALSILGLTVKDIEIPEHWVYYEKTDAYYFGVKDAFGVTGIYVTKVEKEEDGIVKIYWQTNEKYFLNTATQEYYPIGTKKMVYTMQLQSDGTYRVLSNLPEA